ncbi:MAG TPA: 50S ribosomal protein L3 [Verrucomicrobiales bacterium]|jgi:large subunit ribosomal protein L3|nr:50S ribosomal protein L3 [Verrucomicrobiales bacterium]
MSLGLLGRKLGMTHVYDEATGKATAVTVIDVSENEIIQVKTPEKDGYSAVQVGIQEKKPSRVNKAQTGHFAKTGTTPKYNIREFRMDGEASVPASGTKLTAEQFAKGQWVDVIGVTKGRGFAGVVKRYRFSGQRQTHGSMMHRRTGAIGCRLTPGRVWKNQRMPGHMGVDNRTTQNLKVVAARAEDNILFISGSVPGAKGGLVIIRPAKKKPAPAAS